MDLAAAARTLNDIGYGYIGSWALLTACEERVFDRLPARVEDLADIYPDGDLVTTWFRVLEGLDIVQESDGVWSLPEEMSTLLTGDNSYADYLGGQVLQQMVPRLTLGTTGHNMLGLSLAPVTGKAIADLIAERPASIPLDAVSPTRFS